jgi:hypothetical protein
MVETVQDQRLMREKEKKEGYEQLCGGQPDAISVLARTVRSVGTVGRVKTGGYRPEESDIHGNLGSSHAGVVAAKELKKYFPEAKIVTNSRIKARDNWPEERHAEIAAAELQRAHIPADHIIVQDNSFSTLTELLETIRLTVENRWKHVVILVPGHQVERVTAMLEMVDTVIDRTQYRERPEIKEALKTFAEQQKKGETKLSIIASEDVLSRTSPRHRRVVEAATNSPEWKALLESEKRSAEEIRDGKYGQKHPGKPVEQ